MSTAHPPPAPHHWPTFAFRLPPDQLIVLRSLAAQEGQKAGEIIRRGLRVEMERMRLARLTQDLSERAAGQVDVA